MTPTVPDGPDTKLAAAIRDFLDYIDERGIRLTPMNPRLDEPYVSGVVNGYLTDRAVLARPAAGRDLTDDRPPHSAATCKEVETAGGYLAHAAGEAIDLVHRRETADVDYQALLEAVSAMRSPLHVWRTVGTSAALPAVARTDGQSPADDAPAWDRDLASHEKTLTLGLACAAVEARAQTGDSNPRMSSLTVAVMTDWLIQHGWPAATADDTAAPQSAAELPATLRTVEDVAAVCEAAGLRAAGRNGWGERGLYVSTETWPDGTISGVVVDRTTEDVPYAQLSPTSTGALLLAAIRAAQGGDDRG